MDKRTSSPSATDRIRRIEACFDALHQALSTDPDAIHNNPTLRRMVEELTAYYDSPQWLADYEADEQGLLPSGLKRGVLSQDGIDNLLWLIRQRSDP